MLNFEENLYVTARLTIVYHIAQRGLLKDFVIPPICAAVYFSQFLCVRSRSIPSLRSNSSDSTRDKTSLNYASVMGFPITGEVCVISFIGIVDS